MLGALRRLLQRADGFLVGLENRRCEMPGSAVRVLLVIRQCVGKRAMDGQTLVRRRRLVDRRPHERMPEIEPASVHGDEACPLGKVEPARAGAERLARSGDELCVLQVVGRGDQQDALGLVRKPADLLEEDALDVSA